jgi:hypothetical protein
VTTATQPIFAVDLLALAGVQTDPQIEADVADG